MSRGGSRTAPGPPQFCAPQTQETPLSEDYRAQSHSAAAGSVSARMRSPAWCALLSCEPYNVNRHGTSCQSRNYFISASKYPVVYPALCLSCYEACLLAVVTHCNAKAWLQLCSIQSTATTGSVHVREGNLRGRANIFWVSTGAKRSARAHQAFGKKTGRLLDCSSTPICGGIRHSALR